MKGLTWTVLVTCTQLVLLFGFPAMALGQMATICVDADEVLNPVNQSVLGNAQDFYHGDLLLDTDSWTFIPQALDLVSDLRPTVLRFPGGSRANEYFWEDGIGPQHLRPGARPGQNKHFTFHYGTDEHMALCEMIDAEPFITINCGSGIVGDSLSTMAPLSQRVGRAANWVEYCNAPNDGSNPNGGVDWAARRAENGHPEPYEVNFWEIGNAIHHKCETGRMDVETYAQVLIAFSRAMKAIDPEIKIGAAGSAIAHWRQWWNDSDLEWNATLLEMAHQDIDFLVVHCHYPGKTTTIGEDLYKAGLAGANQILIDLVELRDLIDQIAGPSIGIVAAENAFFAGGDQWDLNSTLLAGLHYADLLMTFVEQDSALNLQFACSWKLHAPTPAADIVHQEAGDQWLANPEYYAQQMFREHFGDILVANSVDCGTFSTIEVGRIKAMSTVPELSVCTSLDSASTLLYLMVINKQLQQDVPAAIQVEGFNPQPEAHIWTLNGPSITATNEENPNTVRLVPSTLFTASPNFEYTFPAHSLTVIELNRSVEDSSAPKISSISLSEITGSSVQVRWLTDKPADSKVEYRTAQEEHPSAVEDSILTEEHVLFIEPLQSETHYYFQVISCDAEGNTAISERDSFWTADVTPPDISQLETSAITDTSATICWWTDEPADSWIEYRQPGESSHTLSNDELTWEHAFVLKDLQPATQYSFWVSSSDSLGNASECLPGSFVTVSPRSGAAESGLDPSYTTPSSYKLEQNYPNPFNALTNIAYRLPRESRVTVRIYNSLGQLVRTLVEEDQPPGHYQFSWDSKDEQGEDVASGVYFCSLLAGDFREVCKMMVLR